MFETGFNDLAGQALRNFDGFRNAAAFSDQSGNVGAGAEVTVVLHPLDANADGYFFDLRNVFLPGHDGLSISAWQYNGDCKSIRHLTPALDSLFSRVESPSPASSFEPLTSRIATPRALWTRGLAFASVPGRARDPPPSDCTERDRNR